MEFFLYNCHPTVFITFDFFFSPYDCQPAQDKDVAPLKATTRMKAPSDGQRGVLGPPVLVYIVTFRRCAKLFVLEIAPGGKNELIGEEA